MREISKIAAKWWRNKLERIPNQAENGGYEGQNGDDLNLLSLLLFMSDNHTSDQLDKFEKRLSEIVDTLLSNRSEIELYVDYQPEHYPLIEAAREAEISIMNFPFKTGMNITLTEISVKEGYRQPYRIIYPVQPD